MTDNEIISQWRGECRHEYFRKISYPYLGYECFGCNGKNRRRFKLKAPNYSGDPGAWTPELFGEIGRAGLAGQFMAHIITNKLKSIAWQLTSSTPEQKARALAMAIKEVER